jgi:hypothetical protein
MAVKTIKWDGEPITKPGMYAGIDIDLYHAAAICDGPSISSSGLRTIFNESPAHFFARWRGNPNADEEKISRAFIVGRAAHHLHLGQAKFSDSFAIQPTEYEADAGEMKPWNNNAKECRKWQAARKEENRSVLTATEAEQIVGMAEELGRNPIVAHGALNGLVERSLFWKDAKTGIWLKSRPDAIPGDSGDFVDYKTTESVQWTDLVRTIGEYGYHQQGALVREAAREVLGIDNPSFALVFQEKKKPYCVRVVTLKDSDLDRGKNANRLALDTFAQCMKAKHWPGPGGDREDAEYIEISDYMQKRIDDQITMQGGRP